jgi:hypothetical protein
MSRRGISLMEVLISMFVLAVGLLGVAALIPAGRHEIVEATKLETAAMIGRNAFRDIEIRRYLDPTLWRKFPKPVGSAAANLIYDPSQDPPFEGGSGRSQHLELVLDPLGAAVGATPNTVFPSSATTIPLRRIVPFDTNSYDLSRSAYDLIFRSSVDLITEPNAKNKDLPPTQKYLGTNARRASYGNYSWMATIVSDQSRPAKDGDATVSVAVFYKRELSGIGSGEYVSIARPFTVVPVTSGGEMTVANLPTVNGKKRGMKPGQWFMMAGIRQIDATPVPPPGVTPPPRRLRCFRWYRVLSAAPYDAVADEQRITIAGQDWPVQVTAADPVQVWIFDNIVNVYEKSMPLQIQ